MEFEGSHPGEVPYGMKERGKEDGQYRSASGRVGTHKTGWDHLHDDREDPATRAFNRYHKWTGSIRWVLEELIEQLSFDQRTAPLSSRRQSSWLK